MTRSQDSQQNVTNQHRADAAERMKSIAVAARAAAAAASTAHDAEAPAQPALAGVVEAVRSLHREPSFIRGNAAHSFLRAERLKKLREAAYAVEAVAQLERGISFHEQQHEGGLLLGSHASGSPSSRTTSRTTMAGRMQLDLLGFRHMLLGSWVNALLVCVPFGIAGGIMDWPPLVVFLLNFLAVVPLASLLGGCTEELAFWTGPTIGGLVNATLGNAPELIISIMAMRRGLIRVIQASLLGSVLSNSLLVLGTCFLAGGLRFHAQRFNKRAISVLSSILFLSAMGVVFPSGMAISDPPMSDERMLLMSRVVAVMLIACYAMYLYFTLKTHTSESSGEDAAEVEEEDAALSAYGALSGLFIVTIAVATCSEFLTGAIEPVSAELGLSQDFIGLVLLPIVGNAAEHLTAVSVALKNKLDLAMAVALGSSIQVALFVVPFLVLVGAVIDSPLSLHFSVRNALTFFLSVNLVCHVISDGQSNWLKGALLLGAYIIIAIGFFF